MIWALTKRNHDLSCNRLIRWWLRVGLMSRLVISLFLLVLAGLIFVIFDIILSIFVRGGFAATGLVILILILLFAFIVTDTLLDYVGTKTDIEELMNRRDVALATRAEYIGGHPKLPHGRFVYLLLEGSLEAPVLTILLPSNQRGQPDIFPMSLLEVEKAKSLVVKLVNASAIIGHRLTFVNEYTGEAGRKHEVKLAHFFSGTDEVQDWENYIVCLQAEADTGKQPFGRWKSLPHASRKLAEPLTPSVTLPERDGRNNHPWLHRSE